MFDGVKRVLIIMNGPTTARLNWDLINEELKNNEVGIIVTNGFLSTKKIIDSPNVLFLVNDPLIEFLLNGTISNIDNPETRKFLLEKYNFDNDHVEAFRFDYESCQVLLQSKNIKVAMRVNSFCKDVFPNDRIVNFDFSFLDKVLIKFSYKWHQDGSEPTLFFNKYGIKTFPFESRFAKNNVKYALFGRLWYKINFCQTPNTFYRALDLALKTNIKEIIFLGRNSQINDWLLEGAYSGNRIPINYSYFFANVSIEMQIKNFESILRELYYSSQYIRMLTVIYPDRNFFSLEKSVCYKDHYSAQYFNMYLK